MRSVSVRCPFVASTARSIPDNLLETELFGHEKARSPRSRAQARSSSSPIGHAVLDEIVTPLALQAKILRALEDAASSAWRTQSLHVVCALWRHHKALRAASPPSSPRRPVFPTSVFPITIPPLRDRQEDIAILARLSPNGTAAIEEAVMLAPSAIETFSATAGPATYVSFRTASSVVILSEGDTIHARSEP